MKCFGNALKYLKIMQIVVRKSNQLFSVHTFGRILPRLRQGAYKNYRFSSIVMTAIIDDRANGGLGQEKHLIF